MIDVVNLDVDNSISIDFLYITFELSEAPSDLNDYTFTLQRSLNPNVAFTSIANVTDFKYVDRDVNLLNETVSYYYRVKTINNKTGESRYSDVKKSGEGNYDRWSYAIAEIERKYIKDVVGNRKAFLLNRIKYGEHCPECYNPNRECADSDTCKVCWGTGVKGGYYPPSEIYLNFYQAQGSSLLYGVQDVAEEWSNLQAWTLNFPKVKVDDIIIYGDKRFIVNSVTETHKNGWVIRQVLGLNEIPKTNIIYSYEVDHGLS